MMKRKLIYLLLFIFCIWLALATRSHHQWFPAFVVEYGGDTIWAGMFVFFLRIFFSKTKLWKIAVINFLLGAVIEISQLFKPEWLNNIRHTYFGGLLLGHGFLWSDLVCYAVGTLIAWVIVLVIEKYILKNENDLK